MEGSRTLRAKKHTAQKEKVIIKGHISAPDYLSPKKSKNRLLMIYSELAQTQTCPDQRG